MPSKLSSHRKHVATAVPAAFGSLEEADRLFHTVKSSGLKYMMFETSCFHADLHAMREIYKSGGLGKPVYSEGEYYHYMEQPIDSYKGWRIGLPPQFYPTHSNAYHICVTGGSFTEVSCLGSPSMVEHCKAKNNRYQNAFGTEIAMFRTSEGGMARMAVVGTHRDSVVRPGRMRGQRGTFHEKYEGLEKNLPVTRRPPLPCRRALRRADMAVSHGQLPRMNLLQRHSAGPDADGEHRDGIEPHCLRHRRPPFGGEGRRTVEDPAVSTLI